MLEGLAAVPGGDRLLPFVRHFYGSPSTYLWEDGSGQTHMILQGEGGEKGDPLMPLLFSLGMHTALVAAQRRLRPSDRIFAFLDDVCVVCLPERVQTVANVWAAVVDARSDSGPPRQDTSVESCGRGASRH